MNLVWFKRDLRVDDNAALLAASKSSEVIPLYIYEDDYWELETISQRHRNFTLESVNDLKLRIAELGGRLLILKGKAVEVLGFLHKTLKFSSIFSHEETGNNWTYGRDLAVKEWCKENSIEWHEFPNNGVVRKLKNRDGWAALWNKRMSEDQAKIGSIKFADIAGVQAIEFSPDPNHHFQKGGRDEALNLLDSFLMDRGKLYRGGISSPNSAVKACSRLSPYISAGCISVKEIYQSLQTRIKNLKEMPAEDRKGWLGSLKDFQSRLYWHCHFIQKLELMPSLEYKNIHSAYDGLRENHFNEDYFNAWKEGRTGFPFIDACMRYLNKYGWINFRMRAMLVSFSTNNLWLHWRPVAQHLGRMFTDYEPGIHYPQVQMQAGTTGINAARIYNPVKQSEDQDPTGEFIRKYVPELANVSIEYIHTPWKMPTKEFNKLDYLPSIVDHLKTSQEARANLFAVRKKKGFKEECAFISKRIASRKKS